MKRIWMFALALLMLGSVLLGAPMRTADADADRKADEVAAFAERHLSEPKQPERKAPSDGVILFLNEAGEWTESVPFDDEDSARGNIKINKANFPDDVFRKLLRDAFKRDYMTESEASRIRRIDVTGMSVGTLKGIEFFPNLETLYCGAGYDEDGNKIAVNHIAELDISKNKALYELYCDGNEMTKLNLSNGCWFRTMQASDNLLTELDLRGVDGGEFFCLYNRLKTVLFPENGSITTLDCSYNQITHFDFHNCRLQNLTCSNNPLKVLDVSGVGGDGVYDLRCDSCRLTSIIYGSRTVNYLHALSCMDNELTELNVPMYYLQHLYCMGNEIESLDLSEAQMLYELLASYNALTELNLENCRDLCYLDCSFNALTSLDVHGCEKLKGLACVGNGLTKLDLADSTELKELYCYGQANVCGPLTATETGYAFDCRDLELDPALVSAVEDANYTLEDGVFTFAAAPSRFTYLYDTQSLEPMDVTLFPPFVGKATVQWTDAAMQYKGTTPYLIYDGKPKTPTFEVLDEDGEVILPYFYTYEFAENTRAGTAYLNIRFAGSEAKADAFFKIYLPAPKWLKVNNVENGIQLDWASVDGAAGSVIYRRAWSTATDGWTAFKRWNNTTETTWIDGSDDSHRVFAGSRYQYGIKAYFERRVDPVSGAEIGGNVNEDSGNFNLGLVSPLKTTVRITTRVLESVTGGDKQITVKWGRSQNFTGYIVQIATDENFTKNVQKVKITKWETGQRTFKDLKANTTYYARVLSYHVFDGTTYYGQWSNVMSAKTN